MSRVSSRCSSLDVDEASRYFRAVENFGASLEFVAHSSRSKQLRSQDPSVEWPWAPDYETLLQTPNKRNWESNSRKENWDSSKVSFSRSEKAMVTATVRPSRSTPAQAAPSGHPQGSVDLDSRMRRVLEEVKGMQVTMPSNSFEEGDGNDSPQHAKTKLRQWCIEKGLQHVSHDHKKKQTHHHHHHTDTNSKDHKEYNGPRRNSLTDPPPKEHVPNYGMHPHAVKMWKNHQPKQPAKGDMGLSPAAKPMPRQVNIL